MTNCAETARTPNEQRLVDKVHFTSGSKGRRRLHAGPVSAPVEAGRIPRITRMLALAHRFDRLLQDGVVADQADLARLGHVSRARVTQIMNLLQLAPDIQSTARGQINYLVAGGTRESARSPR